MRSEPIKLAVLVSGSGTTLQNLCDHIDAGTLAARVVQVIGSRDGLRARERVAAAEIPYAVVDRKGMGEAQAFSAEVIRKVEEAGADLLVLAGWLCHLHLPERWFGRAINIHPALLPSFGGRGMYGRHVHEAVLARGCKVSGCTVHFVDNEYDAGPIILQRSCPVLDDDTAETLAARVFEEEKQAYPRAIRLFAERRLRIDGRRVRVD